jgi:hypothetical protein
MSTTAPIMKNAAPKRVPMTSHRKISLTAGVLYLITFVSIPTLALYGPVTDPNYVIGSGPDAPVLVGGLLEMIVALACIGTAVALYPVVKRQNEGVALGFVGVRILEATLIVVGVVSLLSIVSLRQAGAGTDALVAGQALLALHDKAFLLSQALLPAVNALLLGSLMYRSRLVPRWLPVLGLIGAPILIASVTAKYLGIYGELSAWSGLAAVPIAVWEISLGVYLVVKGFKPSPIIAGMTSPVTLTVAASTSSRRQYGSRCPAPRWDGRLPHVHHQHDSRCPAADGGSEDLSTTAGKAQP